MRTKILDVPFDVVTPDEALEKLLLFLQENENHILCTPNPEIVMAAQDDYELMQILQKAELVVPDGIGIVLASRLSGTKIKSRVAGCDLIFALFDKIKDTGHTVYLLGGKPGVCAQAKKRMERKFTNLRIIGYHHGYFNKKEEKEILADIRRLQPDILLCGLGFPKQEKWISTHKKRLPVKISAGVGGSLDVMANTVKRAPVIFQKMGLEWAYRLIQQPSRIGRILQLPVFVIKVLKEETIVLKNINKGI